jgi:hypothetical protein
MIVMMMATTPSLNARSRSFSMPWTPGMLDVDIGAGLPDKSGAAV